MPILMGLDLGEKRIGVALSDESATLATPHETLDFVNATTLVRELRERIEAYKISKIVVGLPITLKGEEGPAAENTRGLVGYLQKKIDLEWVLWDERLTTAEVERVLIEADVSRERRKDVRDQLAAQRILQSYLDSQRR